MGIFQRNGHYYIDYYLPNEKRKRESIGVSKKLAEAVLSKRILQLKENKFLDIKRDLKIKFRAFSEEYMRIHVKQNNQGWKRSVLPNMKALNKFFAGKYLYEITPILVEKFKVERCKTVSPATTNRCLALLKTMFNKAIVWGRFNGLNPVKNVDFFKENNIRVRYLEKEQIAKLLESYGEPLRSIMIVALNTGMRKNEIFHLKWQDIDFNREVIYIVKTKNGDMRELPMNKAVKTTLMKVLKQSDTPYIFPNKDGKPLSNIRKSFSTALQRSGISDFRFHDLRHTFASQLSMSGVDLHIIMELMGHKSLKMTLRYAHLSPGHKKIAVDTLARQMDTFWTLEPSQEISKENPSSVSPIVV